MEKTQKQHLALAREHYAKREYSQAEVHLLEVLKQANNYADVYNMLGVIQHDRGDFQEARQAFERALQINPQYTEAALNLAVTFNELGLYDDARAVYAKTATKDLSLGAPKLDPFARGKIANLHADVAQAYADFGMWPEAAIELRKALWLCPQFPDVRTRLGNVMREMGDVEGACREYREALAQNENYTQARLMLGISLYALGRQEQAEKQWETVLEREPDNRNAQLYLKMARNKTFRPSQIPPPPVPSAPLPSEEKK